MNTPTDDKNQPKKKPVSPRKLKANQENAKKSTGPKTLIGKARSSRGSLQHGLLANVLFEYSVVRFEEPEEFHKEVDRLRRAYQPVGMAEELEFERIVKCHWRSHRAWRFENGQMRVAQNKIAIKAMYSKITEIMIPEYRALMPLLQAAKKEIQAGGTISLELKEKIFAANSTFRDIWPWIQEQAEKAGQGWCEKTIRDLARESGMSLSAVKRDLESQPEWQLERDFVVPLSVIEIVIKHIEVWTERDYETVLKSAYEQEAIPSREDLDRLLRYEAANRRELAQAIDRLERLQRRRKGEPVLPPVSVQLMQ